ncbi:MAG: Gfo/Idh/MocA family oxidoreductase [Spirochaetales bacterium]|nr:Gfo/Idh/MocA family oxidoreductase [Spirochaetales bacterium]
MADTFKWGIIGPGRIAAKFAEGLQAVEGAELYAAASRTPGKAEDFLKTWGGEKTYSSYEALLEDSRVDAVYISTPHVFHKDNTLLALKAGKPVLCEKPMTVCEAHTRELVEAARRENVYLMEAMWSRFFPLMGKIRDIIAREEIGDVRMVTADFGYRRELDPTSRQHDLKLGGGAILDVGIYPLSFFHMILGEPAELQGAACIGETGVDEQSGYLLKYARGQLAMGSSAVCTDTPCEARIMGTKGRIHLPQSWWSPGEITIIKGDKVQRIVEPFKSNGYNYEAEAVMQDVRAGRKENAVMPLDDSLTIARMMDRLKKPWGLTYPGEPQ